MAEQLEVLAQRTFDDDGTAVEETLYRLTEPGKADRFQVHVHRQRGDVSTGELVDATLQDLWPGGRFAKIGIKAKLHLYG